jgi:hypothetical protein
MEYGDCADAVVAASSAAAQSLDDNDLILRALSARHHFFCRRICRPSSR